MASTQEVNFKHQETGGRNGGRSFGNRTFDKSRFRVFGFLFLFLLFLFVITTVFFLFFFIIAFLLFLVLEMKLAFPVFRR